MTAAVLLTGAGATALVLLLSEVVLSALHLHAWHIGSGRWAGGVAALAVAAYWADHHTAWPSTATHAAAVAAAGLLTCLWFNDQRPHASTRPATGTGAPGNR